MVIANAAKNKHCEKEEICMNEHIVQPTELRPRHHIPPHERRGMISIEFEERDWDVLNEVFGDEDTAAAAVDIIHNAPPEIQILAAQIIKMIEEAV